MKKYYTIIFLLLVVCLMPVFMPASNVKFAAFIRFKNEMKTLPAMLESIEGVFDHIVMIHSIEEDDGSIAYAKKWCANQKNCEIHGYPYVIHQKEVISGHLPKQFSFSEYYNFGLKFFKPEEYVTIIDGDQIYIKENLEKTFDEIRKNENDETEYYYAMQGYNSFAYHDKFYLYRNVPIIGKYHDHFIIKRKNIKGFNNSFLAETIDLANKDLKLVLLENINWFHFMKRYRDIENNRFISFYHIDENDFMGFTKEQSDLFEKHIRLLLIKHNLPYKNVELHME